MGEDIREDIAREYFEGAAGLESLARKYRMSKSRVRRILMEWAEAHGLRLRSRSESIRLSWMLGRRRPRRSGYAKQVWPSSGDLSYLRGLTILGKLDITPAGRSLIRARVASLNPLALKAFHLAAGKYVRRFRLEARDVWILETYLNRGRFRRLLSWEAAARDPMPFISSHPRLLRGPEALEQGPQARPEGGSGGR